MARFVRYDRFGGTDVLYLAHEEPPHPGPGQVRVRVRANGLNPADYKTFHSAEHAKNYGAVPPVGVGFDFAGEVDELGAGVTRFALGDGVIGGKRNEALGEFVIVDEHGVVTPRPAGLDWEIAGALPVAARTAIAAIDNVGVGPGDVVFVSAAAGGVGVIASQLALLRGATVVGTASAGNHEFLRGLGVIPVAYGDGLAERLADAAGGAVTAALDNHGPESVDAALDLGVPLERINTIAARGHRGAQGIGNPQASDTQFVEIVEHVASGRITVPIAAVYPLERVAEAYDRLEAGHVRGKLVVVPA